jgi:hypothetical protein
VTRANSFKVRLSFNGEVLGWLGQDGGEWAILVTDQSKALTLEMYPYNEVKYYRRKDDPSRYMSVSNNTYVGFYGWSGATGFTREGHRLKSDYNKMQLSISSKNPHYIFANNKADFNVLDVEFVNT